MKARMLDVSEMDYIIPATDPFEIEGAIVVVVSDVILVSLDGGKMWEIYFNPELDRFAKMVAPISYEDNNGKR